jgi:hypothetical protein
MQGRFKWCGACWIDGARSVAIISLRGLPLCKTHESEYGGDSKRLDALKEKWDAMPAVDSGPRAMEHFTAAIDKAVNTQKPTSIKLGELRATVMSTSAYIARFGSIRSKGMRQETMELWERLQTLPMGQCLVIYVPDGQNPFKLRASLSNTIQRLIRLNKPPYKIVIGANRLKQLVVIAKEPTEVSTRTIAS